MLQEAANQIDKARVEAAEEAGLTYVNESDPGIARKRAGKGFAYVSLGPFALSA